MVSLQNNVEIIADIFSIILYDIFDKWYRLDYLLCCHEKIKKGLKEELL